MTAQSHIPSDHSRLPRLRALAGLSFVAVAGCAAQGTGQGASVGGASSVASGVQQVQMDGRAMVVSIQPGPAGTAITSKGTRAVSGQTLRVTGATGALAMDQGALAKKSAREACSAAGGRLNEGALGSFDQASGAWVFAGGCA